MEELQHEAGSSRRTFLASAGVGVAVVGATAVASPAFASTRTLADPTVVLTVVDAARGLFAINVGEREVLITDKAFASKIATAIR